MTCRALYRLEDPDYGDSTFHRWYFSHWTQDDTYNQFFNWLCAPWDDPALGWDLLYNSGVHLDYFFAFASLEQIEAVWGPREFWPEEFHEHIRTIFVLPGDVRVGETQVIYHKDIRIN